MNIIFLFFFAFVAGFLDSIVGGGGLIQLPAVMIFLPGIPIPTVFGTNKFAGFSGTVLSAISYTKHIKIHWNTILPALISAFLFSFIGAKAVSYMDKEILKPMVFFLLIAVAIYTFIRKDFGIHHAPKLNAVKTLIYATIMGSVLGFYDGFFGPGMGSFLIITFVSVFGFDFLNASASAKIINSVTNLAALIYFIYAGYIIWEIAIPLAAFNMLGSWIGSKMAIKKGSSFVRILFLTIVSAMIIKFGYDLMNK